MGFFKLFKDLKDLIFSSKRNIITALTLGVIILALPLSFRAILNQQQIIKSRATTGGSCNIGGGQNPSVGDQCASCIINNNSGLLDSIKSICGNPSDSNLALINYWCNQLGQADCNTKKAACGSVCGATTADCRSDLANLTITPSSVAAGGQITFQAEGSIQGTRFIEEDYGGGANNCTFTAYPSIPRDTYDCRASSTPGNYTWTHKWRNSEGGTLCQKTQTYTVTTAIANTNNAACGTFKINNSTDQATVTAGSQFDVSLVMNNPTGSKTWKTSENYRLGKVDGDWALPDENRDRVRLPSSEVTAGNTATFNFRLTAPNTAGSLPLNLRMVQDGVEFFGATCSKSITVGTAISSPSPSPSPRVSPSPQVSPSPGLLACVVGDLNKNGCIDPGFDGGDFQTWLRIVTGRPTSADEGKGDVFPACTGDGKKDINDFNLWFVQYLNNRNICR